MQTKEDIWPIARELLRKELPLRVRLLGIRMSTLKDLTIEDKGIKQVSAACQPFAGLCGEVGELELVVTSVPVLAVS